MATSAFKSPYRALWEITWRCDRCCAHCLIKGGSPAADELSTAEALALVDALAALGVRVVSLTGGEPFLRPDWREIGARVHAKGMALRISANGHWIDDAVLRDLVAFGAQNVTVSLDGVRETHDRLRPGPAGDGESSFDRVMATIARVRAASVPVHVITSISRQNLDELPQIHTLLKAQRVDYWILQLAHRTGRLALGEADGSCEPIEPRDLLRVADFIVRHADDPVLQPMAFNSIGYLSRQEPIIRQSGRRARHPIWRGCQCGITTMGIEPDGGIKGCANQVGAPFVVGNIRTEPLRTIWEDRARWHWLKPTPDRMRGDCARCALARFCGAGCTTLALRSSGELFNNPYCLRVLERRYAE